MYQRNFIRSAFKKHPVFPQKKKKKTKKEASSAAWIPRLLHRALLLITAGPRESGIFARPPPVNYKIRRLFALLQRPNRPNGAAREINNARPARAKSKSNFPRAHGAGDDLASLVSPPRRLDCRNNRAVIHGPGRRALSERDFYDVLVSTAPRRAIQTSRPNNTVKCLPSDRGGQGYPTEAARRRQCSQMSTIMREALNISWA